MNRSQTRALLRLPVTPSPWEVALIEMPVTIEGVETEGLFVVVEQRSELVRAAGPIVRGKPLWSVLGEAFRHPAPPNVPARPPRLLCADHAVAERLRAEVAGLGIAVDVVDRVPAVDEVVASIVSHLGGDQVPAPGLSVALERWASTLGELCRIEPWLGLPDSVTFRFRGAPELAHAVAIVLGLAGQQEGVVLFPSAAIYDRFLGQVDAPSMEEMLDGIEAFALYVDPGEEFTEAERAACQELGLELPHDTLPRAMALRDGASELLTEREQRALLAAVEAIVGLCAAGLAALETEVCSRKVPTSLGPVTVTSTPAYPLASPRLLLDDVEHAVGVGALQAVDETGAIEHVPALVIKLRKRDAERLAAVVAGVDTIVMEAVVGGLLLRALTGEIEVGPLTVVRDPAAQAAMRAGGGQMELCISAGGPSRRSVHPKDFVCTSTVTLRG